jgi:hypothetical protein
MVRIKNKFPSKCINSITIEGRRKKKWNVTNKRNHDLETTLAINYHCVKYGTSYFWQGDHKYRRNGNCRIL